MILFTLAAALLARLLQDVPDGAQQIAELIDAVLKVLVLVPLLVPVAELRKLLGGLPDLPLPGGHRIRAGRWFSWVVAGVFIAYGHWSGILHMPADFESFQAWYAMEVAILGFVGNYAYDRVWVGWLGMPDTPPPGNGVTPTRTR